MLNRLYLFLLVGLLWTPFQIRAQTNISGTINTYDTLALASITGLCSDTLVVAQLTSYTPGDLICLYVAADANFDTSNTATFGDTLSLNASGRYAFAYVQQSIGPKIILDRNLNQSFPAGAMLIKSPQYAFANVNGTLTAPKYQNGMGGVLVLKARRLKLSANIDLSEKGFSGGFSSRNMGVNCGTLGYKFPLNTNGGAPKGTGIGPIPNSMANGRGKAINAGGGGNNHNAGGGGGSNAGSGGQGGKEWSGCSGNVANGGLGGLALAQSPGRLFFGGGGGSGHNNVSGLSSEGGDGGGIVILLCDTLEDNGGEILVNGGDGKSIINQGAEGAGGGGAGGSVALVFSRIIGNVSSRLNGGDGGDCTGGSAGPGGGGGGGQLYSSHASLADYSQGNVFGFQFGGASGSLASPSNTYGASAGQNGGFSINLYLSVPVYNSAAPQSFSLGADTALCTGDSLYLQAPNFSVRQWSNGSSGDSLLVVGPGVYWLEVGQGPCLQRDSIIITLKSSVNLSIGPDTSICAGDSLLLQSPYPNGNIWNTGSTATFIYAKTPGWYSLTYSSDSTCTVRDSLLLSIRNSTAGQLLDTSICPGDSLQLQYASALNPQWNDGSTQSTRYLSNPGTYWVQLEGGANCSRTDTIHLSFLNVSGDSSLIENPDTSICEGRFWNIDLSAYPGDIQWFDGGTQKLRSFWSTGIYSFEYRDRCIQIHDTLYLKVVDCDTCKIFFPNAFSPNGDGLNDFFSPISSCEPVSYRLVISDRWGEKIFESNSWNQNWDGYFKGQKAMQGIYLYDLIYTFPAKQQVRKQGYFLLSP